jgi:hypothetical protein
VKLSTIRAQSGKKWRRVAGLGRECGAVAVLEAIGEPSSK